MKVNFVWYLTTLKMNSSTNCMEQSHLLLDKPLHASSHLQLLAAPLTIAYEEGTSIGPGLASSYAAITTLNLGRVSLVEVRLTSVSMSNMVYCC